MSIILGIDVGGSTTKIVGFRDSECVGMLQVEAGDQITSAFGAFGKFSAEFGLRMGDIKKIMVTGVGAPYLEKGMYDIPTTRVNEFIAMLRTGKPPREYEFYASAVTMLERICSHLI